MALIKQDKEEPKQIPFKRNPIIDAELNDFIRKNEKLVSFVKNLPREELERKYLLSKMNAAKQQEGYNQKVLAYMNHPQNAHFKEMIMGKIPQNIPENERPEQILKEAKIEIRNTGMRIS